MGKGTYLNFYNWTSDYTLRVTAKGIAQVANEPQMLHPPDGLVLPPNQSHSGARRWYVEADSEPFETKYRIWVHDVSDGKEMFTYEYRETDKTWWVGEWPGTHTSSRVKENMKGQPGHPVHVSLYCAAHASDQDFLHVYLVEGKYGAIDYGNGLIDQDVWEFYQDKAGEWRWRRTARNGEIVGASSEGYSSRRDCVANARRPGYTGFEEAGSLTPVPRG